MNLYWHRCRVSKFYAKKKISSFYILFNSYYLIVTLFYYRICILPDFN